VGESYLFSRGEKRLQVLDKRTGKPFRVEVQNAKRETVTGTIWNWLLLRVEQTFTASNLLATPERTDCRASGGFPAWSEQMFEPCWHCTRFDLLNRRSILFDG